MVKSLLKSEREKNKIQKCLQRFARRRNEAIRAREKLALSGRDWTTHTGTLIPKRTTEIERARRDRGSERRWVGGGQGQRQGQRERGRERLALESNKRKRQSFAFSFLTSSNSGIEPLFTLHPTTPVCGYTCVYWLCLPRKLPRLMNEKAPLGGIRPPPTSETIPSSSFLGIVVVAY